MSSRESSCEWKEAAEALRLLACSSRILILLALQRSPKSVGALVTTTGLSQSLVSQHLAILRRAGAVRPSNRNARRYEISDLRLIDVLRELGVPESRDGLAILSSQIEQPA